MKFKIIDFFAIAVLSIGAVGIANAAIDVPSGLQVDTAVSTAIKLTAGEVRKVDLEQGKLTIKHEALENLDMPGMTMVFKASDAKLLKDVKQGDKILFRAEKSDSGFMIVRLEQAK